MYDSVTNWGNLAERGGVIPAPGRPRKEKQSPQGPEGVDYSVRLCIQKVNKVPGCEQNCCIPNRCDIIIVVVVVIIIIKSFRGLDRWLST